ncbi:MAG: hypothetical protein PHV12_02700 [Bacteroidales bacterium]|nr:hypothetical protein [Bacteroidales bacterium]MDD3272767.1 hypothetical protein [Bacteroidales bacterium]
MDKYRHYSLRLLCQLTNGVISEKPSFNSQTGEKLMRYENFGRQSSYGATISISELPLNKPIATILNHHSTHVK